MALTSEEPQEECRRKLPLAPLLTASGLSISALSIEIGVHRKSIHRWVREGVPYFRADEIAIMVLGVHPSFIYGDGFFICDLIESSAA